jgi:hypothetical protein
MVEDKAQGSRCKAPGKDFRLPGFPASQLPDAKLKSEKAWRRGGREAGLRAAGGKTEKLKGKL